MAEEAANASERKPVENLADRTAKYREIVERVVSEVGEHPDYELKRYCSLQNLAEKTEFVKDIQSIATSRIQFEKYIVIGADEGSHSFCAVQNPEEFDEASVRQILDKYLDPVPDFEVFRLATSAGVNFVLFVIPKQKIRRILVKVTVQDPQEKDPKVRLSKGDLWTKGASTAKRLATPEDWDDIYDDLVQVRSEELGRKRAEHFIQMAIAGERLRSNTGTLSLPTQIDEAMLPILMEDISVTKDQARLGALIERLRDDLVEGWSGIGAYENNLYPIQGRNERLTEVKAKITNHINTVFRPAVQRLTLIGLYIIKQSAPPNMLSIVIEQMKEVFELSHKLELLQNLTAFGSQSTSADQHSSHTVPALEVLCSAHLLGSYAVKRHRLQYFKPLIAPDVRFLGAVGRPGMMNPLVFWPLSTGWGEPIELQKLGGRISLCVKKGKSSAEYGRLLGDEDELQRNLCAYEFLLELNSHLASTSSETPETKSTAEYFSKNHPEINMSFVPHLIAYPLSALSDLAITLFKEIRDGRPQVLHQVLADEFLANTLAEENGEEVLGKLLVRLRSEQSSFFLQLHRFPLHTDWPSELEEAVKPYMRKRYTAAI